MSFYSRRQIKGNDAFLCNSTVKQLWIVLIDKFCKLTHFCGGVMLSIGIFITLSCWLLTILFLFPVPESVSLRNDIGSAKSPKSDIPSELTLKNLQIADLWKPIFLPISVILRFALQYATICALWESVSWPIVINKNKWVNTKKYKPEQQNSNPYPDMGILGINIFGQGIQIFLNTFTIILGCQESVLVHKKASFPFIWRLLYVLWDYLLVADESSRMKQAVQLMNTNF